jgi:hypothetical protein
MNALTVAAVVSFGVALVVDGLIERWRNRRKRRG